jgi:hypothetical protein
MKLFIQPHNSARQLMGNVIRWFDSEAGDSLVVNDQSMGKKINWFRCIPFFISRLFLQQVC